MADSFYTSPAWRRVRRRVLVAHPRCQVPGCTLLASQVDHVRAIAAGGDPFGPANLRAMCQSCHSRKTASADGGFGNRRGGRARGKPGCDAEGRPVDPGHRWNRVGGSPAGATCGGHPDTAEPLDPPAASPLATLDP